MSKKYADAKLNLIRSPVTSNVWHQIITQHHPAKVWLPFTPHPSRLVAVLAGRSNLDQVEDQQGVFKGPCLNYKAPINIRTPHTLESQ